MSRHRPAPADPWADLPIATHQAVAEQRQASDNPIRARLCAAERSPIRIESQPEQKPRCHLPTGHDGPHAGITLDSDDRPITERWASTEPGGSDRG